IPDTERAEGDQPEQHDGQVEDYGQHRPPDGNRRETHVAGFLPPERRTAEPDWIRIRPERMSVSPCDTPSTWTRSSLRYPRVMGAACALPPLYSITDWPRMSGRTAMLGIMIASGKDGR